MTSKDVYKNIIENIGTKQRIVVKKEEFYNEDEYLCFLAFEAISLGKDVKVATKTLDSVSVDQDNDYLKSLYNEVLLFIGIRTEAEPDKLLEIANRALGLNPDAAIAKTIKGYVSIQLGNPVAGIDYYMDLIRSFPNADWIYDHMVRKLIEFRATKNAKHFISKVKPKRKRVLYYLVFLLSSHSFSFLYLISYVIVAMLYDQTIAFILFSGFPILLIAFGKIINDLIFIRTAREVLSKVALVFALLLLLKSAF